MFLFFIQLFLVLESANPIGTTGILQTKPDFLIKTIDLFLQIQDLFRYPCKIVPQFCSFRFPASKINKASFVIIFYMMYQLLQAQAWYHHYSFYKTGQRKLKLSLAVQLYLIKANCYRFLFRDIIK